MPKRAEYRSPKSRPMGAMHSYLLVRSCATQEAAGRLGRQAEI